MYELFFFTAIVLIRFQHMIVFLCCSDFKFCVNVLALATFCVASIYYSLARVSCCKL